MAYQAEISRKNPGCFLFLIDQSESMEDPFGGGEDGRRKAEELATILNKLIHNLCIRCAKSDSIYDYFHVCFQAEDGIRCWSVTGVQTCALPILRGGIEGFGRLLLDQLLRELQLRVLDLPLRYVNLLDRPHLAGVEKLLHDQAPRRRPDHHDVLLAARRPASDRAALRLAQRAGEQRVRLGAPFVGSEVVRLVEVHRVDGGDRDEFGDLRAMRSRFLQRLEPVGSE